MLDNNGILSMRSYLSPTNIGVVFPFPPLLPLTMHFLRSRMPTRRRTRAVILATLILCGIYFLLVVVASGSDQASDSGKVPVSNNFDSLGESSVYPRNRWQLLLSYPSKRRKELVVASMKHENTSWLGEHFPNWHKSIYVVDDENAELRVEKNKGRESMVYLTYIIDHYHDLPEFLVFIHAQRYQWHNDDPYYDGVPMLKNFQFPYLDQQGYVNLRCVWALGCPEEIHPFAGADHDGVHAESHFLDGYKELFPEEEVPEVVGVSCCAQFGVTRWKIMERPKRDYERFKTWLLETDLSDELSGRIMEYSWHMIFGMKHVHCPVARECYCNTFGLCNLTCNQDDSCEGRYLLPRYSTLPLGWPYIGWDGQSQDPSQGGLPAP